MGRRQQAADRAMHPAMRSPGHPKLSARSSRRSGSRFAKGLLAEEAAGVVGVSPAVGARWFRHGGGMRPVDIRSEVSTDRYLTFREREEIALLKAQGAGVRQIARAVGRDPWTISRELRGNAETRGGRLDYRASVAHWKADLVARRPECASTPLLRTRTPA